jgi:hypothetical protein
MSKFLLNLLLQISKALVYSKIKFLFGKEFSFTFGPIGPAASRTSRGPLVFFPLAAPLSPLGLSLSAGISRPLGLADRTSVEPCPIAASHSKKRKPQKLPSPSSSSTIATWPRPLPASCRHARGASSSRLEDPIPPPLHRSSYTPSTRALTSFNGLNRHSPSPPLLRPFNRPSPPPEPLSQPL